MTRTSKLGAAVAATLAAVAVAVAVAAASGAQSAQERVRLDGERTALTPSTQLSQALAAGGVTLAPAGRASAGEGGGLVFPIVRGRVDRQSLRGRIVHRGALLLTRGERSLRLRRLVIRTTKRGSVLAAKLGRRGCGRALRRNRRGSLRRCGRVPLARLANLRRADSGGLLVATADLVLTRVAARRINRRLGAQVVTGGVSLGTAKVEARPR